MWLWPQDMMVNENIIKLEVKRLIHQPQHDNHNWLTALVHKFNVISPIRLRDGLYSHADEVLGLEKHKLQLETVRNIYMYQ